MLRLLKAFLGMLLMSRFIVALLVIGGSVLWVIFSILQSLGVVY